MCARSPNRPMGRVRRALRWATVVTGELRNLHLDVRARLDHDAKLLAVEVEQHQADVGDLNLGGVVGRGDGRALEPARTAELDVLASALGEDLDQAALAVVPADLVGEEGQLLLERRDPLIEAARFAEKSAARMPGFGKKLHDFLRPLFADATPERKRLIRAACLLHDTTWRAHPDYRAEACFDNVTRANLGGLSHGERVFLGLALLHRYKNSRAGSRLEPVFALLTDRQIQDAEILGKAMRFGAMFSIKSPQEAGTLAWSEDKKELELLLYPSAIPLFGEVAQARFKSLADAMEATATVTLVKA